MGPIDHRKLLQQALAKSLSPIPRLHPDFDNPLSLFSFLPKRMPYKRILNRATHDRDSHYWMDDCSAIDRFVWIAA
jgi:hypothetical protein